MIALAINGSGLGHSRFFCYFVSVIEATAFWSFKMSFSRRSFIKGLTSLVLFRFSTVTEPSSALTSVALSSSSRRAIEFPRHGMRLIWQQFYVDADECEVK